VALITNPEATAVIAAAMKVHSALGPGLFESVYEECLCHELRKLGLSFKRQVTLPLTYDGRVFPRAFTADLIVEGKVLAELKSVERFLPIYGAQVLTYLRITGIEKGLLLNFNTVHLKDGIRSFLRGGSLRGLGLADVEGQEGQRQSSEIFP
jgi:GxxExxY protein